MRHAAKLSAAFNALVMPVHHCGKDESKGMRGSSALHGSADAEWAVSRRADTGARMLSIEKMKDGPDKGRISYELENGKLGVDADGSDILTCFATVFAEVPPRPIPPLRVRMARPRTTSTG